MAMAGTKKIKLPRDMFEFLMTVRSPQDDLTGEITVLMTTH